VDPVYAFSLGVVQALTEVFPVSSSGHLVLMQKLFGLPVPAPFFNACLHVGILAALCLFLRRELARLALFLVRLPVLLGEPEGRGKRFAENEDVRFLFLIILGIFLTSILGLAIEPVANALLANFWMVGVLLVTTGGLLWLTRRVDTQGRPLGMMQPKDALIIGLIQGIAVLPGLSKCGVPIAVALFMGIDGEAAIRYCFLLAIPTVLGALVPEFGMMGSVPAEVVWSGGLAAAGAGFLALQLLQWLVRKGRLFIFAPYCWGVGLVALMLTWS
jgi:undecaprenyl-diphosphatase